MMGRNGLVPWKLHSVIFTIGLIVTGIVGYSAYRVSKIVNRFSGQIAACDDLLIQTEAGLGCRWSTASSRITTDHHGYYDIQSEVGKGTEFALYFPVMSATAEDTTITVTSERRSVQAPTA